jgi:hypothetical protein
MERRALMVEHIKEQHGHVDKVKVKKSKLLNVVKDLKDDLGFYTILFQTVVSELPTAYSEYLIREEYFKRCHSGEYYVLSHNGKHFTIPFATLDEVEKYLWSALPNVSIRRVKEFIKGGMDELYGFVLTKKGS